jgi:hypothetical protein
MQSLTTCLMFVGDQFGEADEAMNFYVSLFEDSRVVDVERFGAGEEEPEGAVKRARFLLAGREFIAMDSRSGPTSASEDRRAGPRPRDRQGRPCQATPVTPLLQFPAGGAGESREVLTHCHFPPARLLGPHREKSVNRWVYLWSWWWAPAASDSMPLSVRRSSERGPTRYQVSIRPLPLTRIVPRRLQTN